MGLNIFDVLPITQLQTYHPASNGHAEQFVQSLKMALKSIVNSALSLQHHLSDFLLSYHYTPHAITGVSPSSLFLHCHIRTRLDLIHPDYPSQVLSKTSSAEGSA